MLDWIIYSWYCPNCKEEVAGLKDKKNQIKVKCSRCGAEMIRTIVGRRHDVIDLCMCFGLVLSDFLLRFKKPWPPWNTFCLKRRGNR